MIAYIYRVKFKHLCLTLFISTFLFLHTSFGQTNNYRFSRKIELPPTEFIVNALGVESDSGAIVIYQISDALDGHYLLLAHFDNYGRLLSSTKWSNGFGELGLSGLKRIGKNLFHLNGLLNDGVGNRVFAIEFDQALNVLKTYSSGRSLASFLGGDMHATSDTVFGLIHTDIGPAYYVYDRILDTLIGSNYFVSNTDPVFQKITKAKNGLAFLAGNSSTEDLIITALDKDLNFVWANAYQLSGSNAQIKSMEVQGDSLLLIAGFADRLSDQANSGFFIRLDLNSGEIRMKVFNIQHDLKILDIEISDSTYLLCGEAEYYGNGIQNGFILELNSNLDLIRTRVLDADFSSSILSLNTGPLNKTYFTARRNDNEPNDSGFMGLINDEVFCEIQEGVLDIREDTIFANPRSYIGGPGLVPWDPIQIIEDTVNLSIQATCDLGNCFFPLDIRLDKQNLCIGDTLRFYVDSSYNSYSWAVNGIDLGSGPTLIVVYNGGELEVELDAMGSNPCFYRGIFNHAPINGQAVINGPSEHCPFNEALWYQTYASDSLEGQINISNGEILISTEDSVQITWKGKGSLEFSLTDTSGCLIAKDSILFSPDSGNTKAPEIFMVSFDRASEMEFLEISLPDYNFEEEDKFELYQIDEAEEVKITDLIEGENKWISPQESELPIAYQIRVKNECNIDLSSNIHKRVNLEFENGKLSWSNYLGWNKQNTTYKLMNSNGEVPSNGLFEFQPMSFEALNDCYIVLASNGELNSYSNEICLKRELDISFTNFVSQNADGKNDYWIVDDISIYPNHHLKIYNRWGKKVFESRDYKNNWPDSKLVSGDYFFHFDIKGQVHYKGWIKLVD